MTSPLLFSLLVVLAVGLTAALAVALKNVSKNINIFLEAKIGNENFTWLKNTVETVVKMLMQSPIYRDIAGPEKKQMAIAKIREYLSLAGIDATLQQIDDLIEACLAEYKKAQIAPMILGEAK